MTAAALAAATVLALAPLARAEDQRPSEALPTGPSVTIVVERAEVARDQLFWIEVTVRWPAGAQVGLSTAVSGGASDDVTLAPGSPFEVVRLAQAATSLQMRTGANGVMQSSREQRLRWQVRATQPGQHAVVVQVRGKLFRDPAAVVSVGAASPGSAQPF